MRNPHSASLHISNFSEHFHYSSLSHTLILEGIAVLRVMEVFDWPFLPRPLCGWGVGWRRWVGSKALWLLSYQNHIEGR